MCLLLHLQALTPHMQPAVLLTNKSVGKLLGPALGDQKQGCFSINLWKNAFQDACQRLCPVRAGGHECGCLPVLARMVTFCTSFVLQFLYCCVANDVAYKKTTISSVNL